MKKFLTSVLLLAALTALILAGCGNNNIEDSVPEELNAFGVTVNPSAVPSTGEFAAATSSSPNIAVPNSSKKPGNVEGEHEVQGSAAPASPSPTRATTPVSTPRPSTVPTVPPQPSPSDSVIPSPPASESGASADQARAYIGKTREELFTALGYPSSTDYEPIDEEDPSKGDIGTLYFAAGFTVTTERVNGVETVTAVNEG